MENRGISCNKRHTALLGFEDRQTESLDTRGADGTAGMTEGFDVVLLDGRALSEVGGMLAREGLCRYALELFFVCDPFVSAQRTLQLTYVPYGRLDDEAKRAVEELVQQITTRNRADRERAVQPVVELPHGTMAMPVINLIKTYI